MNEIEIVNEIKKLYTELILLNEKRDSNIRPYIQDKPKEPSFYFKKVRPNFFSSSLLITVIIIFIIIFYPQAIFWQYYNITYPLMISVIVSSIIRLFNYYKEIVVYRKDNIWMAKEKEIFKKRMKEYEIDKIEYPGKMDKYLTVKNEYDLIDNSISEKIKKLKNMLPVDYKYPEMPKSRWERRRERSIKRSEEKWKQKTSTANLRNYENNSTVLKAYLDTLEQNLIVLHCPSCGFKFSHKYVVDGKITGGTSGAAVGALMGGKIGIAMGPLGAIAGTIPGAILGGIFGKNLGNDFDKPRCAKCQTTFDIPNNLK